MNIYLHTEIVSRELDSKLLLATLAAARGHHVIVSDLEGIEKGLRKGILPPGIFHTKSLTPGNIKIARHQTMMENGSIITSIDEEGCLDQNGYDKFAKIRYSDKSIEQSSAVFGWGSEDVEALKRIYQKHSSKIFKTGSPRADLWKSFFSTYWGTPRGIPQRPFLLVPSKISYANNMKPFHEIIKTNKLGGYFERDPDKMKYMFGALSENYRKMAAFIEAIKYLAKYNNGYDIVLRPHPVENVEAWKIHFEDISNVHVIREGSLTPWINKAFAVMHNSCTSALEATISKKPVVTYIPFQQEYSPELPNRLGFKVKSLEELSSKINNIFDTIQSGDKIDMTEKIPEIVEKKLYFDKNELAAEKMVKVWESLANERLSKSCNWAKFQWFLKLMKFRGIVGRVMRSLSSNKLEQKKENYKFPSLDKDEICEKIKILENILKIDKNLECKLLSERTVLIKKS